MFDLGWTEMMLVAAVAVIVVGPKDLPRLMRTIGQFVSKARGMASELQNQFMDIANQSELEELRNSVKDIPVQNPLADIEKDLAKATAGEGLNSSIHELEERDSESEDAKTDPAMSEDYDDMEEWDAPEDVETAVTPPGEGEGQDAAAEGPAPQEAAEAEPETTEAKAEKPKQKAEEAREEHGP